MDEQKDNRKFVSNRCYVSCRCRCRRWMFNHITARATGNTRTHRTTPNSLTNSNLRLILINRPLFSAQKATQSSRIIFQYRTAVAVMREQHTQKTPKKKRKNEKRNYPCPCCPAILIVIAIFRYCYTSYAIIEFASVRWRERERERERLCWNFTRK